ncbi:Hypothetical_protein [Hexamita inflata]|uniref:Hypothetical_protein n=1 Tax=Hexamita inflata TaxID=28002 RepID=A0ABP1H685_9EUKA
MFSLQYVFSCIVNPVAFYDGINVNLQFYSTCDSKHTELLVFLTINDLDGQFSNSVQVQRNGFVNFNINCTSMVNLNVECEGFLHQIRKPTPAVLTVKLLNEEREEKMDIMIVYDP